MLATIAICTRNRAELLRRNLEAIEQLLVPDGVQIEVVVCDNNSSDVTQDVVQRLQSPFAVRLLFEPREGKSYALAKLICEARGDWIFFLDDDVMAHKDWLIGYCEAIRRYPNAAFFGGQILPQFEARVSRWRSYLLRTNPGVFGVVTLETDARLSTGTSLDFGGANVAFCRQSLLDPSTEKTLRLLAEHGACCEDAVLMLDQLRQGREGWMLVAPKVSHYIPVERVGVAWFSKWWFGRGRSYRKIPSGFPEGFSLRRFAMRRRMRLLRRNAVGLQLVSFLLTLLSIVLIAVGFLTTPTRPHGRTGSS